MKLAILIFKDLQKKCPKKHKKSLLEGNFGWIEMALKEYEFPMN
jgi:hypothetical protein